MMVSYNMLIVATWWCAAFNGWRCQVVLNEIGEHYLEGVIWHLTLLAYPVVLYLLLKEVKK